ncbi:?-D-glucose-1-phosphatase [Actinomyces bovis]|uniref:?-D-glucose-1-phosphatase n=1 Tax=Actinomyces bovis TaxID=1658 RepID=A0ABY1VQL0_9ACTO|nr:HAD family phosphatase [Actinomyces bovis]SPT54037.1 ?-D-glucose-1-phosphatase [Actinomyces bovis]VEG53805.1 ?-D-glucose-1-phosphatase [Actinomyces israelii]
MSSTAPSLRPQAPIKAIVFDYGNVMISWDPAGAVSGRIPLDQWDAFVEDADFHALNLRSDAGDDFEDVIADLALAHPEHPEWPAMMRTYRENFEHSILGHVPGTVAIVRELLDAGVPLYLLSNFDVEPFEYARGLVPELEHFQGLVISAAEHLAKPDPQIYRITLERYHLDPATTLFIDDTAANVAAARAVGMQALRFTGAGRLRAELTELGLISGPAKQPPSTPVN